MDPDVSNDSAELDKLLTELEKPTTDEETKSHKKDDKNPFKGKKNDESNTYEYSDDIDLSDGDW